MEHTRLPTLIEQESLVLANKGDGKVVLTPIFFNGQARMALAYMLQAPNGSPYLRVLGVCLEPGDVLADKGGNPASQIAPTAPDKKVLN